MLIRKLLLPVSLSSVIVMAGCVPAQPQPPKPVLTPEAFSQRIDALESQITGQCDVQQQQLVEQRELNRSLRRDMREVGSQLRRMHAEMEQPAAPQVVQACKTASENPIMDKTLLGRVEWVGFPDIGSYFKARIDTGANTSSLSARDITEFERDGDKWVKFKLALREDAKYFVPEVRDKWVEAKVSRTVTIVQASGREDRPVVSMLMTLGDIKQRVEFTLNDRRDLTYPVLLGRRFMMDIAAVDVSRTFINPRPEFPGSAPSTAAAKDQDPNEGNRD